MENEQDKNQSSSATQLARVTSGLVIASPKAPQTVRLRGERNERRRNARTALFDCAFRSVYVGPYYAFPGDKYWF